MKPVLSFYSSYLEKIFSEFSKTHPCPQLATAIIDDKQLLGSYSFGFNDSVVFQDPYQTQFRIASMTKCFGALLLLKLAEEGSLSLSDTARKYLPYLKDSRWDRVTLRDLLTMQSGLPTDDPWGDRMLAVEDSALIKAISDNLHFCALESSEFHYSNLGYMILGLIVKEATKADPRSLVEKLFLTPLKMSQTNWTPVTDQWLPGFVKDDGGYVEEPALGSNNCGAIFAGLWSTIEDLARWMRFIWSARLGEQDSYEQIVSSKARVLLQSPQVKVPVRTFPDELSPRHSYGYGLAILESSDVTLTCHSGGLPGYGSHFCWDSTRRLGAITLSNHRYAPVAKPTQKALLGAIHFKRGASQEIPELIKSRAEALIKAIQVENFETTSIFSSNFFLDNPVSEIRKNLEGIRDKIAPLAFSEFFIVPERGFTARIYVGDQCIARFSLSPAEDAKIQELQLKF